MKSIQLLSLGILTAATIALAQPHPPLGHGQRGPAGGPPPMPDRGAMASYLNLTSDQKASWQAAQASFEVTVAPLQDKAQATHMQLEQLMNAKSTDATAIGTLMITIRSAQDAIKAQHDALDTQLESVLTADQKAKFEAFRAAAAMAGHKPPRP